MRKAIAAVFAMAFYLLVTQGALAGAPLKGIDVKLGKNPGGGCAARVTDEHGNADFGVWPKGNYTLTISSEPTRPKVHLAILGTTAGAMERDVLASASARTIPIAISLNGTAPLKVSVSSGGMVNTPR